MAKRIAAWEVSDQFWSVVEPLIPQPSRDPAKTYQRKPGGGRRPLEPRRVFEAIVFVLRTGIQWKALPKERYGSPSSIHAYFRVWEKAGFFDALWRKGLAEYDEMIGVAWEWQSVDGAMIKAPLAQEAVGPNPTDRGKKGSKRHMLTDGRGVPLSIVVTAANIHDVLGLPQTLRQRRRAPEEATPHLCADAGYTGKWAEAAMREAGFVPHVRSRREEKKPGAKPRRWVVEACHSWFNRFRKLLVRFEKTAASYRALCLLAAAIIALRKTGAIYG
jgi:Transposase and inactivated derivatives